MTPAAARQLVDSAPARAPHRSVLLCRPDHYRIAYAINPHMRSADGTLKRADPDRALHQWEEITRAYRSLGLLVETLPGDPACPDMVFAANQSFPFDLPDGRKGVLLSNMHAPERRGEVAHFESFFKSRGYDVRRLSREEGGSFEGHGDLIWHPARRVLWGGWGFRTSDRALARIASVSGIPVVPLRLVDPRFYHLDTCFMPLDGKRALVFPPALEPRSLEVLSACFDDLIVPPESEATLGLACNADCPDGRNVLIEASCTTTAAMLEERGFVVHRLETSEFLKAGGSVFCMKLALA